MSGACLAIVTLGGPTAVLNATLLGFAEGAVPYGEALGVVDGPEGLTSGRLRGLGGRSGIDAGCATRPGSWLGAGRRLLTDDDLDRGLALLWEQGVRGLAVVGGNGSMACAARLAVRAGAGGLPVGVVGVPKTIDNDIRGTDHSPGFASAASFVIEMVADLAFDHRSMRSIEPVRIIETLGRNTGWLALSSLLARGLTDGEPHLVYVPERPFDETGFLADVQRCVSACGRALVVVAEGSAGALTRERFETASYHQPIEGGVARVLAERVRVSLKLNVRAEVLGLVQRCSSRYVSDRDREEAFEVGHSAARLLGSGESGVMVTLDRSTAAPGRTDEGIGRASVVGATPGASLHAGSPSVSSGTVALTEVAGVTRHLPAAWVPASAQEGSPAFEEWLRALLLRSRDADDSRAGASARQSRPPSSISDTATGVTADQGRTR